MNRSQQQLVLLVVLIGVMIVVLARALTPQRPSAPLRSTPQPEALAPDAALPGGYSTTPTLLLATSSDPSQREVQRERAVQLAWGRDPFLRGSSTGGMHGLTLSGILWDPQAPIAILNGEMLHVGDELDGYQIVAIAQDRVSVSDGTETFQLLISP